MIPYTYLIGWPNHDRWYYGVRYSKTCNPDELWVTYKTSSRHVAEFVQLYGEPSIIEIRKIFNSADLARRWEQRVLRKMNVVNSEKWINRTDNISITPLYGLDNPATRPEVKILISKNTPKKFGDDNPMRDPITASKVSQKLKGRRNYWQEGENNPAKRLEVRKKLSRPGNTNPFYGKTHSDELKHNTSLRFKDIPKEKVKCPHCDTVGGKNTMGRWHFENCKSKEKLESKQ
jgi:hypothetical protein